MADSLVPDGAEILVMLDEGFAVVRVPIGLLVEQDKNAHMMPIQMRQSLAANIRRDGHLESLPLTHRKDEVFEIISGHHRVLAAKDAGQSHVDALAYLNELPKGTVRSKQLAHNSHVGSDDAQMLRELYLEIDDPDERLATFLDPEKLQINMTTQPIAIEDVRVPFDWHYVAFAFLPYQRDAFDLLCSRITSRDDTICVMPEELFAAFGAAAKRVGLTDDIRNVGTVVARMVEIVNDHLDQQEASNGEAEVA